MKRSKANLEGTRRSTNQDGAPPPDATKQNGDLLIRVFWQNGTYSVHEMSVVNTKTKNHTVKTVSFWDLNLRR